MNGITIYWKMLSKKFDNAKPQAADADFMHDLHSLIQAGKAEDTFCVVSLPTYTRLAALIPASAPKGETLNGMIRQSLADKIVATHDEQMSKLSNSRPDLTIVPTPKD